MVMMAETLNLSGSVVTSCGDPAEVVSNTRLLLTAQCVYTVLDNILLK